MGKKKNKQISTVSSEAPTAPIKVKGNFLTTFKIQALVLIIVGLICFSNSFYNQYALDDGLVIKKNEFVQQGFQGIPKILSSDAFESFADQMHNQQGLFGGRYRPLSIVTFAIEQQLFGSADNTIATIRHVINVLLYILSVVLLLFFLRNFIFKQKTIIAFIASLLFLIHPIHTEVVANIKSRDEIFSFLFIILTFIYVFRFADTKKTGQLILGLLFYLLALLSKEYAITLLVFIPMLLYIVKGDTIKNSLIQTLPFFGVATLYIIIRLAAVGFGSSSASGNTEILDDPFLYATAPEKWATKIEILNHYLRLLFYPNPLSSDYSYNTIPYTNFGNGLVWMSIGIHLSMIAAMVILFLRRNILSFAIAFYLLNLFLISNLFFDIGATMGERLIYHSSLGFVMAVAILIEFLLQKLKYPSVLSIIVGAFGCLIVAWCAIKDRQRNAEWQSDTTLFLADVKTVPNSVLTNGNAGYSYNNLSILPENKDRSNILADSALIYLNKAVSIDNKYVNGYLQLGFAYSLLKKYDSAMKYLGIAKSLYPNDPDLKTMYTNLGSAYNNDGIAIVNTRPKEAIELFKKSVELAPDNPATMNNLAYCYYYIDKDYDTARKIWQSVLQLDPNDKKALAGIALLPKK